MERLVLEVPTLKVPEVSPEDWMFRWETHGIFEQGCSDPDLLRRYKRGKAMRDWWFKEKGELRRLGSWHQPEEFLPMLMPDCFFELYGRYPITCIVRFWFDNHYTEFEFSEDMRHRELGLDHERDGYRVFLGVVL